MLFHRNAAPSADQGVIRMGKESNDTLSGSPGQDALYGGPGNDLLRGSPAADKIYGDAGTDTVDYSGSRAGISVNLATGIVSGGDATGDRLSSIEQVVATDHADTLTGDGENNKLKGRGGDDTLDGGTGNDTLMGGAGADVIRFGRESGRDMVILDGQAASADVIQLGAGIAFDQLWYAQVGNNLEVSVLGSDAAIVVKNFYGTPPRRGISLRTEAGETLDAAGLLALEAALRGETRPDPAADTLSSYQRQRIDMVLRTVWNGIPAFVPGKEIEVNTEHTSGQQQRPTIAALYGGGSVVAWQDESGRDGASYGVYAVRLDSTGARVGTEFRVNTHTSSAQGDPAAAGLPDGGFVIVWQSTSSGNNQPGADNSNYRISGQRYAADGSPVGTEFQVNTHISGKQYEPAVTALADGGFLVVWTDQSGKDGVAEGVFAQRFAADGTRVGAEFQANTFTKGSQYLPAVSGLVDGGFVIVWAGDYNQDGDRNGVFGQRYAADGSTVGLEFQVNTYTTARQEHPAVTGLVGGGFVITWESAGQDGNGEGIYGQVFDKNGRAVGSEFRANTHTASDQMLPAVTALGDGGFIIAWESQHQDGSWKGIYGQQFRADGSRVGEEFRINQETHSTQHQAAITALVDGSVAVSWASYAKGGNYDISTRVYRGPATAKTIDIGDADPNMLPAAGPRPARQVGTNGDDTLSGSDDRDILKGRAGNDTLAGGGGKDRLEGGDGNDALSGGTGRDILIGNRGHDSLSGDAGRDILRGGTGADTLTGGAGADRYAFARGDGADSIDNADTAQVQDTLLFKSGVGHDQLWFARSGQDLVVSVIGTADAVTVEDWYASADNRHLTIRTEDGSASLADSQVQTLVSAMAGYAPPALGTLTLSSATHSTVETVIAASWQLGG